jgi:hypothetical protein
MAEVAAGAFTLIGRAVEGRIWETERTAQDGLSLDDVLASAMDGPAAAQTPSVAAYPGVVLGALAGFDGGGRPLVDLADAVGRHPIAARSTVALTERDIGRLLVVVFEESDSTKPIVLGALRTPEPRPPEAQPAAAKDPGDFKATLDGERIVLSAHKEIVLRCGNASITLTSAGKVLIRGEYVLSRSSGVNRIKGGSVQIN